MVVVVVVMMPERQVPQGRCFKDIPRKIDHPSIYHHTLPLATMPPRIALATVRSNLAQHASHLKASISTSMRLQASNPITGKRSHTPPNHHSP